MKRLLLNIWILLSIVSCAGLEHHAVAFACPANEDQVETQKAGHDHDQTESKQQLFQIDKVLFSTINLHFHAGLIFEFDACIINSPKYKIVKSYFPFQNEYFKTLFRLIISPNAP